MKEAEPTKGSDPVTGGFTDENAFAAFYLETSSALHGYVARMTQDVAIAEDILQVAYLRLLRAPTMENAKRRAYLYKTATSLVFDRWRRLRRERKYQADQPSPQGDTVDCERSLDLRRLLQRLSDRERALLWLAYGEGFTHGEIGQVLGLAAKSVKVLLFRVREKAKAFLSPEREGEIR